MSREQLETALYFLDERGDVSRYVKWEDTLEEYPELKRAWERYKDAERDFEMLLRAMTEAEGRG